MYAAGACRGAWRGRCTTCRLMRRPLGSSDGRAGFRRWLCFWGKGHACNLVCGNPAQLLHVHLRGKASSKGSFSHAQVHVQSKFVDTKAAHFPGALQPRLFGLALVSCLRSCLLRKRFFAAPALHAFAWICAGHHWAACSLHHATSAAARRRKLLTCASPRSRSHSTHLVLALIQRRAGRAPAWGVCGSAAGALQNLSREIASRQAIRELGAVPALARLLSCPDAQVCCSQQPAACSDVQEKRGSPFDAQLCMTPMQGRHARTFSSPLSVSTCKR